LCCEQSVFTRGGNYKNGRAPLSKDSESACAIIIVRLKTPLRVNAPHYHFYPLHISFNTQDGLVFVFPNVAATLFFNNATATRQRRADSSLVVV
jgi:hypothetical protein